MKPFLALLKTLFKVTFSISVFKAKYFRKKSLLWRPAVFLLAMCFALLPFETGLVAFFNQFYTLLKTAGQEAAIMTLAVLGGQLMVLLFGPFYLLSAFYFSGDLKQLLPLPLRPRDITGAKLAVVLTSEYLTLLLFIAPIFILFGIRSGVAWWYWPFALAVYLLLPVIPLAVASLLLIPLMRLTALAKNRDLFRVAGSLFGVAFFLFIQFTVNRSGRGPDGQQLHQWISAGKILSGAAAAVFPPVHWATAALSYSSPAGALFNLLLFASASLLLLFPVLLTAEKWFIRGVTGGYEAGRAGRRAQSAPAAAFRSRSPIMAVLRRETTVFLRTPVFILNGLINYLMVPAVLFFSLRSGKFGDLSPEHFPSRLVLIFAAAGVIILNNALSPIASTAISREGKRFWISKHLPLSAREQVTAKLIHAMIFPVGGAFLIALILYITLKPPAVDLLLMIILGTVGSLPAAASGLIIDLLRPNLDWTDPQQAIKGFNGFLAFLAGVLMLGILGLTGAALIFSGLRPSLVYLLFTGILLALGLALYWALVRLAEKWYPLI